MRINGDAARYNHREGNDDYSQVAALFHILGEEQQKRLFGNIAAAMQGVPREIVGRQIAEFNKVDPAYGAGVLEALAYARLPMNSDPVSASEGMTPVAHAAE